MRTDLDHLPASKQRELAHVVRVLFEEFETSLKTATQPWKKQGRILKLVLYGSYARGDWVEDHVGGYVSDYDILVVVNDERLTDVVDYWSAAEDRLMREMTIARQLSAPVSFIVHSLADLNKQLERGRPFFADIVRQGLALYEAEGFAFGAARVLPQEEARAEAKAHFDHWYPHALSAEKGAAFYMKEGEARDAAFLLHQAVERLYHCTLLVLTLYSPKSHKLNFLRSQAEQVAAELIPVWPREGKFEKRCFELLRQAYINSRYSPAFKISDAELRWTMERVTVLRDAVEQVCQQRLSSR